MKAMKMDENKCRDKAAGKKVTVAKIFSRLLFLNDNLHISSYIVRLLVGAYAIYVFARSGYESMDFVIAFCGVYLIAGGTVGIFCRVLGSKKSSNTGKWTNGNKKQ